MLHPGLYKLLLWQAAESMGVKRLDSRFRYSDFKCCPCHLLS